MGLDCSREDHQVVFSIFVQLEEALGKPLHINLSCPFSVIPDSFYIADDGKTMSFVVSPCWGTNFVTHFAREFVLSPQRDSFGGGANAVRIGDCEHEGQCYTLWLLPLDPEDESL